MEKTGVPTLYLVDGSNYVFRAFYAIRELTNSRGFPTNAVYGFTTMLLRFLREHKPEWIAVAFDVKGPTFRHEAFPEYKANRKATPDSLLPQIPRIKEVVRAFAIPVLEQRGIEADDILGTLAVRHAAAGGQVVVVSGDKDLLQLVSERILVMDPMRDKTYDVAAVREKFGVGPDKVVEILGLTGDASDNVPGVPGIGPKHAQRLIEEFGTVENVLAQADRVKNARLRAALRQHADLARLSRELVTIRTQADIALDPEAFRWQGPDAARLEALFADLEFSSLLQDLRLRGAEGREAKQAVVADDEGLRALADRMLSASGVGIEAVLADPSPLDGEILGLALALAGGETFYLSLQTPDKGAAMPRDPAGGLPPETVFGVLAPAFASPAVPKHGHDLKAVLVAFGRQGVALERLGCDALVASYLLNPAKRSHDLTEVAREHLGRPVPAWSDLVGTGARAVSPRVLSRDRVMACACARAEAALALAAPLTEKLGRDGFADLFHDVEMPLVRVLAGMELHGVLLDTALLRTLSRELKEALARGEERIYGLAGERFNIHSPKQLQVVLFDKLGLPRGRKIKEGYSTDVDVLTGLASLHPLPAEILAHRSLAKLKSTYVDALPAQVHPRTGRIHTSFNQAMTATGRLSSSNPNLQNIPIRTPEGRRIRQAFVAPPGGRLVSADYSQIELRVLAHLSGDEALVAAFASGADIHTRTASDLFGVFPELVTPEMRRQAKVINFGVLYGMSAFGLGRELGISQKLAQDYIDGYFARYAGVRAFLQGVLAQAREQGYVSTILHRRRYLPEINDRNGAVRAFAERMAVNAPIQGSAADLIKVAMGNIARRLRREGLASAMVLQVHDELVFEAPAGEAEALAALVREEMVGVTRLRVPLEVSCGIGANWDEAHP